MTVTRNSWSDEEIMNRKIYTVPQSPASAVPNLFEAKDLGLRSLRSPLRYIIPESSLHSSSLRYLW